MLTVCPLRCTPQILDYFQISPHGSLLSSLMCIFTLTTSWSHFILCQIYICWVIVTGPFPCPEATSLRCQEGLWDWLGNVYFTVFVLSWAVSC